MTQKRAFTLIELSIALIIIGLLVGGVLTGRELINSAKHSAVIAEIREIETALRTFQLEFRELPGDMPNAFDFWGTDCAATAVLCNGNGNGRIEIEFNRVFVHLSLAGVYPGNFATTPNTSFMPPSSFRDDTYYIAGSALDDYYNKGLNRLVIGTGTIHTSLPNNGVADGPFLPAEGFAIDSIIDDGVASTGRMVAMSSYVSGLDDTTCVEAVGGGTLADPDFSSAAGGVDYELDGTIEGCFMMYFVEQ